MHNDNTPSSLPPAEVMFARKIRSVFDKLLPKQTKPRRINTVPQKTLSTWRESFFQIFWDNKSFWEICTIEKRVGNMIYTIKVYSQETFEPNQKMVLEDADSGPPEEKDVLDVINDTFDIPIPQAVSEQHRLKRKRK